MRLEFFDNASPESTIQKASKDTAIEPLLSVCGISQTYGRTEVLSDISFQLMSSETMVILGESGCGKTTLLRVLAGLQPAIAGEVKLRSQLLSITSTRNRGIVYLDQEAMLFEHLNVFENVGFALRLANRPQREVEQKVLEMLGAVGLEEHRDKRSWQLSGGQKQRVAFARAILAHPQLLLLDEPFCSLDGRSRTSMQELFLSLRTRFSMTCIFVTHDVKEALVVGDRFSHMSAGKLRLYHDRSEFLQDEATGIPDEMSFWQQTRSES